MLGRIGTAQGRRRGGWSRARLLVAGLAGLALACFEPARLADPETPAAAEEPVVEVQTVVVRRAPIAQRITASATLEARRESRIGTEVQGRIEQVFVDEGDRVAAGDPLFAIDAEPYQMAVRDAEARLDLARAQRVQGEADLARARLLRESHVVAEQAMERLGTALAVARAQERQAAEALALARHQLDRTVVRAPWAGSVAARLADEGSTALVQPQTIVLVLQESGLLDARAAIPEGRLAVVRPGDPAVIQVEGHPEPIHTTVSIVGDAIDPATRTYSVRMPVANEDHRLKAGVFGLVEIRPRARNDVLVIPREAIRSEEGRSRVFTIRDGRATPLPVTIGIVSDLEAEVVEGLEEGAPVIVGEAAQQLAPGMRVRVVADGGAS